MDLDLGTPFHVGIDCLDSSLVHEVDTSCGVDCAAVLEHDCIDFLLAQKELDELARCAQHFGCEHGHRCIFGFLGDLDRTASSARWWGNLSTDAPCCAFCTN